MIAACWILALAAAPQEADPAARVEALRRAAAALGAGGKHGEAVSTLRRAVGIPEPPPADREVLSRFVEARAEAQWELAETLYAGGAYAEALSAYGESRDKYPRRSLMVSPCGKVGAVARFEASLGEARCLECLGRHGEAVRAYLSMIYGDDTLAVWWDPGVCFRLVDLYESAGQAGDLRAILEEKDRAFVKRRVEEGKGWISESEASQDAPGRVARRVMELRAWGGEGRWAALADLAAGAPAKLDGFGPAYWEAAETCRILARRPDAAVPLLRQKLRGDCPWICFALGLCGTREAVDAVVEWARGVKDPARIVSLVCALRLGGPAGKAAAGELERQAPEDVKEMLRREPEVPRPRFGFPPLLKGIRLPAKI